MLRKSSALEGPKMTVNVSSHLLTPVQGCCRQELLKYRKYLD